MNESTLGESVSQEVRRRAEKIKVLLMDVDGVLTDGKLFYMVAGAGGVFETKGFNSHDGLGLHLLNHFGLATGVISGRESPATVERARILKMKYVYQGLLAKEGAYEEVLADAGVAADEVAFVGDDFTDLPLMIRSGLGVAVANARPEVLRSAHYVTTARGGEGAVREVAELLLKAQGHWTETLEKYGLA